MDSRVLVNERHTYHRSTYECMDVSPEAITAGHADQDGALFYHVETRCGCLACPPYEHTKEVLSAASSQEDSTLQNRFGQNARYCICIMMYVLEQFVYTAKNVVLLITEVGVVGGGGVCVQ